MSNSDAFALKNSGLNEFLYAEVGSEANGSPLTMLSVLARLGKDPWTEAARLAGLPKSSTIDNLTNSISQMPLSPHALLSARTTAARLFLLLPSHTELPIERITLPLGKFTAPQWIPLAIFLAALGFGLLLEIIPPAKPTGPAVPAVQITEHATAPTK